MYPDQELLKNKRIVITGAGRGLGRALAIVLARHGANVVLLGRDPKKLDDVANSIERECQKLPMKIICDLSQSQSIEIACATILEKNPQVDVLVNNGAPWLSGSLNQTSSERIAATISASVTGSILMTKGLLPGLESSPNADIVTIVSTSGILGWDTKGTSTAFHAAKHGQSGFSDYLRHELRTSGIRVTAIYPPDFDDADPLSSSWGAISAESENMTSFDIVSTIKFVLTAPRRCNYPVIILNNHQASDQ